MIKYLAILLLLLSTSVFADITGEITGTNSSPSLTCENGVGISLYDGTWASGVITLEFLTLGGTWEEVRVSGDAQTWNADDNDNANMTGSVAYRLRATTTVTSVDYDLRCKTRNY